MSQVFYSVSEGPDRSTAFVSVDGVSHTTTSENANFNEIKRLLTAGEFDRAVELFDVRTGVTRKFERLTERVAIVDDTVQFDGERVADAVEKQVLRFFNEGVENWKPLVNFLEKVAQNPNEHSREQLMNWLTAEDFSITTSGDIVGYKGVMEQNGQYVSINRGPARVDGKAVNGHVPNYVGAVVEMPRGDVQHNPSVGCHTGLHVGTWDYASGFGRGVTLTVTVNPRDVVSVPTDCGAQKMRTCRYKVTAVTESKHTAPLVDDDDWDEYDDEDC